MPYNGSGSASAAVGGNYPAVASTLIESGKYNVLIADLLTMLSTAVLKDGQQVATARIPFASGIQTDSVTEKTSDTGVTLDSVLLKDGRIDTTQGADIASAATLNLETATGNIVDVTGTVTVTAVTLSQGHWRLARFTGALILTNGASLVLPGATNFTTAAGDYVLFVGYAAGVVRAYILPTSGPISFVDSQPIVIGSADKTKKVRFEVDGLTTAVTRILTPQDQDFTIGSVARSHLAGLTLSTAGSSTTMSVAAGQATDSTNVQMMTLASALAKTTSAWAVGNAQGGLDTGAIANSTWYHFYVIQRPDTSVVDILFSLSASAPTMPTNYTLKRRIGSGKTDGSGQWIAFAQDGDYFRWVASVLDVDVTNPGTAAVSRTLSVPTGVNVFAIFNSLFISTTDATSENLMYSDLAANDEAVSLSATPLAQSQANNTSNGPGFFTIRTNTSAQIRSRVDGSDGNTKIRIATLGWIDRRGKDS